MEELRLPDLPTAEPAQSSVPPLFLLAYCIEFLLAIVAALLLWSEVGGQPHMDLLPWYVKLLLACFMAWSFVRFTANLVANRRGRARLWLGIVLLIASLMGAVTLYYHLHEGSEEPDTDENSAALFVPMRRRLTSPSLRA